MLNISDKDLIKLSIASLRENYFDTVGGGFFDFVGGRYGIKKLFYNAACSISLAETNEIELFMGVVGFLVDLSSNYEDLVPSWNIANEFTLKEQGEQNATLGEQGLLLWALSIAYKRLNRDQILAQCNKTFKVIQRYLNKGGIPHFSDSDYYVPMTTAFCLDGLLEYYIISKDKVCRDRINSLVNSLKENCHPPVFFITNRGIKEKHIYFNNIAYPIHALSRYCILFNDNDLIKLIEKVIDSLLCLQGGLGQWWWIYSPEGKVVQRYPVYSVHQHGMAIMALKMAKKVVDRALFYRIDKAIIKSYSWVFGQNELGRAAINYDTGLIWRSIEQKKLKGLWDSLCGCFDKSKIFKIDVDCRSYEVGWLLYAITLC